jgi:hypothetical protein
MISVPVVSAWSGPSRMEWETRETVADTPSRKIRKTVTDLEDTSEIDARNDEITAGAVLLKLVRRQSISEVQDLSHQ